MILDRSKLSDLAKRGHAICHGTGIAGWKPGTNMAVICRCVGRALARKGVNVHNPLEIRKAIGVEEVKAC